MINKVIRFFRQKNYGLDLSLTKIEPEDFIFGDGQLDDRFGGDEIIRPDGQWDNDLPVKEVQLINGVETWACPVFGTENTLQILMKAKYGEEEEYTERYHSVLIGITQNRGGSPNSASESVRKNGMLPYDVLPYANIKSFAEFNSPKPMTAGHLAKGKKWLDNWEYGHDWITNFAHDNIKEALKRSPLGFGVYAWSLNNKDVYVKPSWATDNHWCTIFGYVDGEYWKVYDHYNDDIKHVDWNYPFKFMKRYTLKKKVIDENESGRILYERFKGKHIMTPEDGSIYSIGIEIKFEGWYTDSKFLQDGVNQFLREQEKLGNFIGVSMSNFELIKKYASANGVLFDESGKNIINKLKAKL